MFNIHFVLKNVICTRIQNALKVITQGQKDEGEKYMTYTIYFENIETIIRKYSRVSI